MDVTDILNLTAILPNPKLAGVEQPAENRRNSFRTGGLPLLMFETMQLLIISSSELILQWGISEHP